MVELDCRMNEYKNIRKIHQVFTYNTEKLLRCQKVNHYLILFLTELLAALPE